MKDLGGGLLRRFCCRLGVLGVVVCVLPGCTRESSEPPRVAVSEPQVNPCTGGPSVATTSPTDHGFLGLLFRTGDDDQLLRLSLTETEFREEGTEQAAEGRLLRDFEIWSPGAGERCFSGVWRGGTGEVRLETDLDGPDLLALVESLGEEGLYLADLEVEPGVQGKPFAALFTSAAETTTRLTLDLTPTELVDLHSESAADGYRIADLETTDAGAVYHALWVEGWPAELKLGLSTDQFEDQAEEWRESEPPLAIEDLEVYSRDGDVVVDVVAAPVEKEFWQWVGVQTSALESCVDFVLGSEDQRLFCGSIALGVRPLRLIDVEVAVSVGHQHPVGPNGEFLFTHKQVVHSGGSSGPGG